MSFLGTRLLTLQSPELQAQEAESLPAGHWGDCMVHVFFLRETQHHGGVSEVKHTLHLQGVPSQPRTASPPSLRDSCSPLSQLSVSLAAWGWCGVWGPVHPTVMAPPLHLLSCDVSTVMAPPLHLLSCDVSPLLDALLCGVHAWPAAP